MSGRIVITFTGPTPSIVTETDGTLPPPVPPPVPPLPPAPPADDRPFDWPAGGPTYPARDYDRAAWSWPIPGSERRIYAFTADAGNPSQSSHYNAGIIQAGRFQGSRLWAPAESPPALLRAILAGFV